MAADRSLPLPTPEQRTKIVTAIRQGAFADVAAESLGVSRSLFRRWLRVGRRADAPSDLQAFAVEVRTAAALARLKLEMQIHTDLPMDWLRYGPGRDRPGHPGWSVAPPMQKQLGRNRSHDNPALWDLLGKFLDVLTPYPEARLALIEFIKRETPDALER